LLHAPPHVAGLSLRGFRLDTSHWQLQDGPYEIAHLSLAAAELAWPTWQQQVLRLHVSGLRLELAQHSMAQVRGRVGTCWRADSHCYTCEPLRECS
jgi:hypothetical protein